MGINGNKTKNLALDILRIIGLTGMAFVALSSSPRGAEVLIKGIGKHIEKRRLKLARSQFSKYLWYLRKKKYIKVVKEDESGITIKIIGKGIDRIKKFDLDNLKIEPMEKWDSKWRVVIFDIPDKKKSAREALRRKLENMGFYKLQKSVFIHPWECLDEIFFLRKVFEVEPNVSVLVADAIDEEMRLRKLFNISTF
ncbi:MAG: CRISPR-associated endonuclease Cas2 [Candidatus Yanofskybacteria bacterium RIFCSPHIGHO2_02_FULL_41_29]|uniref:CRISPR-associated endoribonuclease Cas2 n=1 Tax=Candidatus Yanofskybacteria bacterium RIFCSPHIGHO2_01_FULL_41_53 TaxID=1802663 RepID=A0A1F8EGU2_9BACT|nr:MAG: CRISPR-associated endonuclease Cas2 [Candidatus Yanofskybacteria bacterium RIFCSPHIGHO2_01_FULL_41_53]OGN10713.1 MAG: CRISPR-associated endonuclease Cas2 [Candidatus Yanofskybacteria bacterium RIFCSPHIGHO2_02_FULL_41_29]OGN17580.1 MAG: CRISPR-associated endonuclease Cas2 [Candidatus Yanofskybacteria bacterium RIFCSPHIGHO2_12_FULL_41_9]OGN24029.1 MAG: CRISPR-associated endonuclease Cas2 [Candidatus Yanofskybacteria bacterium RIFCSPLOWO2_01_FULL_41_67]OGN30511.1 MAG: CRISPR-associated end